MYYLYKTDLVLEKKEWKKLREHKEIFRGMSLFFMEETH